MPENREQVIALVGLLLVVVVALGARCAGAAEVVWCPIDVADGSAYPGTCDGSQMLVESSWVSGGAVLVCDDAAAVGIVECTGSGFPVVWRSISALGANEAVWDGDAYVFVAAHTVPFGGGGESDGGDYEIDLSKAAEPFTIGFLLVATCWALGKGVALVIDLVRR